MAKLSITFEKAIKLPNGSIQQQELVISAKANNREEAANLAYDDFKIDLFINGNHIADISPVLAKTDAFDNLIDSEDWEKAFCDQVAERKVSVTIHDEINY